MYMIQAAYRCVVALFGEGSSWIRHTLDQLLGWLIGWNTFGARASHNVGFAWISRERAGAVVLCTFLHWDCIGDCFAYLGVGGGYRIQVMWINILLSDLMYMSNPVIKEYITFKSPPPCWNVLEAFLTNSMDPDLTAPVCVDPVQTTPTGAVWTGSTLFAPIILALVK